MKYTDQQIKEMNRVYRESLKPDWQELSFEQTDKGKKLPKPSVCKTYAEGDIISLNKDVDGLSKKSLFSIIQQRRSVRKYAEYTMSFDELSYILLGTCFIKSHGPGYAFGVIPTGGATSTLETYLYLRNVEGLAFGLYHFMKDTNQLRLIKKGNFDAQVNASIKNQLRDANIVVYWTTIPYRMEYKYQFVSHKMIAMEAGHACQNLYLTSEALDYGVVAIGAYHQTLADQFLSLDEEEFTLYCATVGKKIIK